jgi:predicted RNA-binding Zn-ribbon protein involved in translation (DUF1610 family)
MLIKCTTCDKTLRVPDSAAGLTVVCPECQARVQVPEARFEERPEADYPAREREYPPPSPRERAPEGEARRPCPMCGEMILADAIKCRYCGEIFDEDLRRAERRERGTAKGDADLTAGEWVVAIICSGIGCIVGIVWMIQGKPKGTKMFVISLISDVIKSAIQLAIMAANNKL